MSCWGIFAGWVAGTTYTDSSAVYSIEPPGSNVTSVSVGTKHICYIINSGVKCWGQNDNGQLGDGTTINRAAPVVAIPENSGASSVATLAWNSTCAVINGGVQCWGSDSYGQLGDGGGGFDSSTPVTAIPSGSNVTMVSGKDSFVCAMANGGVKCWGSSAYGQIGNSTLGLSTSPIQAIPDGSNVTSIGAGYNATCATMNGGVQCWGSNLEGIQGNGGTSILGLVIPLLIR